MLFFYLPLIPLVLFSFNENQSYTVFGGFSLKWYERMLSDNQLMNAIMITISVAIQQLSFQLLLGHSVLLPFLS